MGKSKYLRRATRVGKGEKNSKNLK
jgi:hypothetical protein